eukprot:8197159-Ditylum_brightwellii.AAC.1
MVALSYTQLIISISTQYLKDVTVDLSYVPAIWLGGIREFLAQCNSNLSIPNSWTPQPQRLNDTTLMDIATSCNLGPTTNDHINR